MTFSMIVDMFRILEVMTKHAPEIFVDKNQIHSIRLINYVMFVLHSVFVGNIDNNIEFFSGKVQQRSDTLAQFLAPFLGILKHLYDAVNTLGLQDPQKYD
jgi:ABC-type phosphate/phosphonate transport system permease subunit